MSYEMILGVIGIGSYLIGSISFAIVVSRLRGLSDPRTFGSGNPGATNVLRSGDKIAAALTLLGDALKGWIVVVAVAGLAPNYLPAHLQMTAISIAAFAVFLGHLFPVYFKFQGGKGVATAFGVLLALDIWLGLIVGLVWLVVAKVGRISSLAALSAAATAPIVTLWRHDLGVMFWSVLAIAVLLVIRHKKNIAQLLKGEEKAFKKR
jgi:acyl phosphate:glycerol-3-phosphate acyltransferase